MIGVRHPFTGALYTPENGTVRVTLDGVSGLFTAQGRWIDGELREADPHLCGFVAAPRLTGAGRQRITEN